MLWLIAGICVLNLVALIVIFFQKQNTSKEDELTRKLDEQQEKYNLLKLNIENLEKNLREDSSAVKDTISKSSMDSRTELKDSIKDFKLELSNILKDLKEDSSKSLKNTSESLTTHVRDLSKSQQEQLSSFGEALKGFGDT